MEAVQTLIDKAAKVCGSAYALAKRTGYSEGSISSVRSGKRAAPDLLLAEAAAIVGADPREALAVQAVERERDPEAQQRLARLLGVDWRKRFFSNRFRALYRRFTGRGGP